MKNKRKRNISNLLKKGLICFFVLLLIQLPFAANYAQSPSLTIQANNKTVREVLNIIEKNSQVIFFYADKDVDLLRKVSIDVKNQPVSKVLEELFKNSNNTFKIDGKQVYITIKPKVVEEKPKTEIKKKVSGVILDENNDPLIGASIMLSGTDIGAVTDINGQFSIEVPKNSQLKVSYVGYETQIVEVADKTNITLSLVPSLKSLDDVVVVGYGSQKKQSVVGAIVQAKGSDLTRTGLFTSVGQALTGLLPGVSTQTVTGMPGAEDPKISIRGVSSWNGSDPLVLIDGVERKMSDIDVGQIESISVLKDASATAVFGVKGAEGVILITTKRGKEGKAQISFSSNTSAKFVSRIPSKFDSYDTFAYQNEVLEKQNPAFSSNWSSYLPQDILNKYRNPESVYEAELYPNVDWVNEVTKKYAITQRYELSVSGGTSFAKYFAALSYLNDEDLLKSGLDVGLPYKAQWGFKHYNFRSNLDFNLTKSTVLSVNLAGSIRQKDGFDYNVEKIWSSYYYLSPANFPVRYSDGVFGYNVNKPNDINPVRVLSGSSGLSTQYTTQLFTDFKLKQDLGMITPGLSMQASLSYDNRLYSKSTISQIALLAKSVDKNGVVTYDPPNGGNDFDYYEMPGTIMPETFDVQSTSRSLYYQGQFNYARTFGKNDISALALFSRQELTTGSEFPHYREDWVGRFTYAYDNRYFIETNGAYNGSERFATKYRFGFFPSVGLGWMLSNESFIKQKWLDKLKIRYSIGTVGSDNFASERWSYDTRWGLDGGDITTFGTTYTSGDIRTGTGATYLQYKELVIGNPDLHWEISRKQNLGVDFSIFNNLFSGTLELFRDDRSNVFMSAAQRAGSVPAYFGAAPVAINIGKVLNKGFEFDLKVQHTWSGIHCWLTYNFSHAVDKVIFFDDPKLKPNYQKTAGFQIGQTKLQLEQTGFTNSWDDVYGSVSFETNSGRLPGDVVMIDYNGDGVVDSQDAIPVGYPNRPQNTYNTSFGLDYKGLSLMVNFFGVYNVSQFSNSIVYMGDTRAPVVNSLLSNYWTPDNNNAVYPLLRFGGSGNGQANLTRGILLDGSYLRLKNIELGYEFRGKLLKILNLSSLKLTVSGNNLLFWSKLPEDREQSVNIWSLGTSSYSLYPTVKRINFGINVTF